MPDKNIPPTLMGRTGTITIGIILVVLAFILGYLLFAFWNQPPADASGKIPDITVDLFGFSVVISAELRIVLLVMIVGLIGSYIHTTISFVNFTGRPGIDSKLALVLHYQAVCCAVFSLNILFLVERRNAFRGCWLRGCQPIRYIGRKLAGRVIFQASHRKAGGIIQELI